MCRTEDVGIPPMVGRGGGLSAVRTRFGAASIFPRMMWGATARVVRATLGEEDIDAAAAGNWTKGLLRKSS
jgi:hypothetical protein